MTRPLSAAARLDLDDQRCTPVPEPGAATTVITLVRPPVEGPRQTAPAPGRPGGGVARLLRREDGIGQFLRFVAVGGTSMLLYGVVLLLLQDLGTQPANLAGSVASTVLANELHRRLTFSAGGRVSRLAAQLQGGGMAAAGAALTALVLAWADAVAGDTGAATQLLLVTAVTGLVGLGRFVGLRWAFAERTPCAA
ncbi:GtrA family protein [Modestobacter sp. VKM Ac-2986]|uniref:GtrA family protein n=1 Tax=Modestobacter sp. VKM Ac-2986 TaxID=3004140 RepID=UPI0022AB9842|nr:GtrA family protein [Modestobacter sp. VKM Ac-2986]MCZ2830158.1 GtrA family protein [Modestobacter sp. VKM Ac-2986]